MSTIQDGRRPARPLTGPAFERLLETLDNNTERAADAYRLLHERITGLLRWWGAAHPEELADETLDRVARKLDEGVTIATGALGAYVRGVARLIYYEAGRRESDAVSLESTSELVAAPDDQQRERSLTCLDRCLETLTAEDRSLVLRYYSEHGARKIDSRRQMADASGVSVNALRIRMHRIRERLERCVRDCTEQK
jgi:DNA-directed RNA polymerase specialized sigma24 family protein